MSIKIWTYFLVVIMFFGCNLIKKKRISWVEITCKSIFDPLTSTYSTIIADTSEKNVIYKVRSKEIILHGVKKARKGQQADTIIIFISSGFSSDKIKIIGSSSESVLFDSLVTSSTTVPQKVCWLKVPIIKLTQNFTLFINQSEIRIQLFEGIRHIEISKKDNEHIIILSDIIRLSM